MTRQRLHRFTGPLSVDWCATFIGVSTMALSAGRLLGFPGAVALLTSGYFAGQILGPWR